MVLTFRQTTFVHWEDVMEKYLGSMKRNEKHNTVDVIRIVHLV